MGPSKAVPEAVRREGPVSPSGVWGNVRVVPLHPPRRSRRDPVRIPGKKEGRRGRPEREVLGIVALADKV
jgi:hypothetical protein